MFANETLVSWLGAKAEDLADGAKILDFVDGGDLTYETKSGATMLRSGEVRLRDLSGNVFPATIEIANSPGVEDGTQYGLVVNHAGAGQFGDRRKAARSRRFFNEAPIGIVMIDGRDQIVESNIAFRGMVGRTELPEGEGGPSVNQGRAKGHACRISG